MSRVISISCASDHNYLCGLWVTLHSLCHHCSPGYTLRIHILDCGLHAEDLPRLKALETSFQHCSVQVHFHTVSLETFKDCPTWRGGHATYARLLLQDVLVDEDFTIYTDVDTLWLRDVAELWEQRSDAAILWAGRDGSGVHLLSSGKDSVECFKAHGVDLQPHEYYCAGLLMMHLKRLREMQFTSQVEDTLKRCHAILSFADQDIYNLLIRGKDIAYLDFRWGEFATVYGRRGGLDLPVVIHYAKSAPWTFKTSLVTMRWWLYLHKVAGYAVFGAEAGRWRRRAWSYFIVYALRRSWLGRMLFRLVNVRSAKKYERFLFPERYPLSQDELY